MEDEKNLTNEENPTPPTPPAEETAAAPTPPAATAASETEEDDLDLTELLAVSGVTGSGHADFDWSTTARRELPYSEKEIEEYLSQYESTLSAVAENDIVSGKVVSIHDGDVLLDVNFK